MFVNCIARRKCAVTKVNWCCVYCTYIWFLPYRHICSCVHVWHFFSSFHRNSNTGKNGWVVWMRWREWEWESKRTGMEKNEGKFLCCVCVCFMHPTYTRTKKGDIFMMNYYLHQLHFFPVFVCVCERVREHLRARVERKKMVVNTHTRTHTGIETERTSLITFVVKPNWNKKYSYRHQTIKSMHTRTREREKKNDRWKKSTAVFRFFFFFQPCVNV